MDRSKLQGKRCIALLRCSSKAQTDTSIEDQRKVVDQFARQHGMIRVDEMLLEGLTGSVPGNRQDIQQIIQRKLDQDDFDVLVVQDYSRLTRSGGSHHHQIEGELIRVGIEVISCHDQIPEGEFGDVYKSMIGMSNQHHAKMISFNSARGSQSALEDGRSAYCRRPPYGIDKLYVSPDCTRRHIIRNLSDGTQVMLSPDGLQEITRFGRNDRTGVPNHYIKQKMEKVVLVPGEAGCVEVVRKIFHLNVIDGWGSFRIAELLNSEGIPSSTGGKWNTAVIESMLDDPIYLGQGIANRTTSAIYNMRASNTPVPAKVEKKELYNRRRPAPRNRPRGDWHFVEYPHLADLLPVEVRDLVQARQQKRLDRVSQPCSERPNRDRHVDTSYFLKNILRSVQGNHAMTGRTTGKTGNRSRYYCVSRAFACPDRDKTLRKLIPAGPIEDAVLDVVKSFLLSTPDLREQIEQGIRDELSNHTQDRQQLDELAAERESIRRKIEFVIDTFDPNLREVADQKVAALSRQLQSVNDRIVRCETIVPTDEAAIRRHIDEVMEEIQELGEKLGSAPPTTLRNLLAELISSLAVDLESKAVELTIRIPGQMCLVDGFPCKIGNQAQLFSTMPVGIFTLIWDRKSRAYEVFGEDDPYFGGLAA